MYKFLTEYSDIKYNIPRDWSLYGVDVIRSLDGNKHMLGFDKKIII